MGKYVNPVDISQFSFIYTKFQTNPLNNFIHEIFELKYRGVSSPVALSPDLLCVKTKKLQKYRTTWSGNKRLPFCWHHYSVKCDILHDVTTSLGLQMAQMLSDAEQAVVPLIYRLHWRASSLQERLWVHDPPPQHFYCPSCETQQLTLY
jgi:hypothetical protein